MTFFRKVLIFLINIVYCFKITGSLLRIPSAQVKDRGVYVCKATNEGGTAQTSSILDIERKNLNNINVMNNMCEQFKITMIFR